METWGKSETLRIVGKPVPKRSGFEKVTGKARYASDVVLPGMLYAALVRSTEPRARVVSIDTSKAAQIPGVRAILSASDQPRLTGIERPLLSMEVRFAGEEIAAVAADTQDAAEEAARAMVVKYEKLPAVIEPEDGLRPGVPQLTPQGNLVGGKPSIYERGDWKQGEAEADLVYEQRYSSEVQHHNPLEPHGCVASWQGGELTVWDSGQGVHMVRDGLSQALGLPASRIRVLSEHTGGGFGSKNAMKRYHVIAALLARRTGRPMRLFVSRREEFLASHHRPKYRRVIRGGVKKDGALTFVHVNCTGQAGAYGETAWMVDAGEGARHLYRCPNVRQEGYRVLTNTNDPIETRGTIWAPDLFCFEQFVDEVAHKLGIDPLEFRLRNYAEIDPVHHLPYSSKGLKECYERGAKEFGWKWRLPGGAAGPDKRRGIGMASMVHEQWGRTEQSVAYVTLHPDGSAQVIAGIADIGVGAETIFAQVAAEELGVPYEQVSVTYGDSQATPYSLDSSYASRTTGICGSAVRAAAAEVKRRLLARAAVELKVPEASLGIRDGQVVSQDQPGLSKPLREITKGLGRELLIGVGRHRTHTEGMAVYQFGAHFVEVEVDTVTGQVRVLRAVCAHDVGRMINPLLVESQIQGGFLFGMGMALSEERIMDRRAGLMLNDHLSMYLIPGILDAPPDFKVIGVETLEPDNNLNVKGIGEVSVMAAGAAIANAIYNAIGVRLRQYPITPNKILAALKQGQSSDGSRKDSAE